MAPGDDPKGESCSRHTHLVVLQAADHELGEDDHAGATHPSAAVHHHGGVEAL